LDDLESIRDVIRVVIKLGLPETDNEVQVTFETLTQKAGLPQRWDLLRQWQSGPIEDLQTRERLQHDRLQAAVQKLLDETSRTAITRDRRTSSVPKRLRVTSVIHVKQARQYLRYRRCQDFILSQMEQRSFSVISPILTRTAAAGELCSGLNHLKNEFLPFHGTSHAASDAVTNGSFRVDLAGSAAGSMFGRGLYFAESCIKSDEYADCQHNERGLCSSPGCTGERPLLICRVTLGKCKYTAEPRPNARELEAACGVHGGHGDCHSVLADREEANRRRGLPPTFREFVVFDPDQVYAEYIVWYRREFVIGL